MRYIALGIGILCLGAVLFLVFSPPSRESNAYLLPSLVGLLWSFSAYNFVVVFRSVPERATHSVGSWGRLKRRVERGGYWLVAVLFSGTTLGLVALSYKLLSVWMKDYSGS